MFRVVLLGIVTDDLYSYILTFIIYHKKMKPVLYERAKFVRIMTKNCQAGGDGRDAGEDSGAVWIEPGFPSRCSTRFCGFHPDKQKTTI